MTRVLLVCEFATLNGGEHSMLATLDHLLHAGVELIAAAPARGLLPDALALHGVDIFPIGFFDACGRRHPLPILREMLAEAIAQTNPALVHANSLSMSRVLGPVTASMRRRGLQLRGLGHLRDIVKLSRQAIDDINLLDRRLAVSEAVRRHHIAQGMNERGTEVQYNGVDLQQFRRQACTGFLHRELGIPPSARLLGTVGQISLRKGHLVMAKAMERIVARFDVHWLIVGNRYSDKEESRQFETSLRALAETGPLAGRVHLVGYRTDMPAVYSELAALVHPARQEPLGRVLLEAAACGLPIVATDVGGTREIFPGASQTALLVPPNDDRALAEAMLLTLGDPQRARQMGAAARARIETAFNRRDSADGLLRHYREVLR